MKYPIVPGVISMAFLLAGCERGPTPVPSAPKSPDQKRADDHKDVHGGEALELGSTKIGTFDVRAARDKGDIKPGGEAPIDLWLTTADGKPAAVRVVRIWIGLEDAKGSLKAKAEIEDPKDMSHFHTHAEIPDPLSADSKLWVEIEDEKDARSVGSFALKR